MAKVQPARIKTALAAEDLLFHRMEGTEELGRSFTYHLDLLSKKPDIAFDDVLGKEACVELDQANGKTRYFHGFITHMALTGAHGRYVRYTAELRPWLWFLTRTSDCRIFQQMTVPDIIQTIFRDHGFTDVKDSLSGTYRTWDYCVQYRETAFNFVSRLMEQEGIYYYFTHEQGKHTLVLSDSYAAHEALKEYPEIPYYPPSDEAREEHIFDWSLTKSVQPGKFVLRSFDFRKPRANLEVNSAVSRQHAHAAYEIFDYPGEYFESAEGDEYARARIEELHAEHERTRGVADVRGIGTGGLFTLKEHPRKDQNREYLIVASHQSISLGDYESGGNEGLQFDCSFDAIESRTPFRPARTTPKPVVQGPQTAIIVGKSGQEIWTDEYGRVKVRFHWDRHAKDENTSCWIRVSQSWAGKNWGGMQIPRVGQEVIVEFLEGDPDQPIITGRVYNADNMPPYPLPANATMSTLKTNSSKGGRGFNELRFEDKKGDEQLYVHAEKNMDIRVKNDRFETIVRNRHLVVEQDKREHVKHDRHELVDNHHNEEVKVDRNLKVGGKEAKAVAKELSLQVDGDVIEVFKKNHSEQVSSDYYLKATNVVIEGTSNVTIKVGQSFIAIEASGIKIGTSGQIVLDAKMNVDVKGSLGVKVESPLQVQLQGLQTSVKGTAMVELQGAIVKIN
jgi:type VI secretion system secreted protein VgrG